MDLKDIQESLLNFPQIFKLVWIPHCLLMSYTLRLTYGPSALSTSKKAPFSCLLRNVLYTFPGGVVSSLAMGDPIFSFLTNNFSVTIEIKKFTIPNLRQSWCHFLELINAPVLVFGVFLSLWHRCKNCWHAKITIFHGPRLAQITPHSSRCKVDC